MGRPSKTEEDKKVKIGISLDRGLFNLITSEGDKVSRIIEKIIKEYYENKNLY
jgi:hypothetical protein